MKIIALSPRDAILTTDNEILLRNTKQTPAILCVQKKADKTIITDDLLAEANKNSFGDTIGAITNRVTAMYDIITKFDKNSEQYKTLEYRIKCGQLGQQDAIDKSKGIISKPLPKEWYDKHVLAIKDGDSECIIKQKNTNREIVADRKPYFMIYVYGSLKRGYTNYIKTVQGKSRKFWMVEFKDLLAKQDRDSEQEKFVQDYYGGLNVSDEGGTMNRLCHYVESQFKGYSKSVKVKGFPYQDYYVSENFEANTRKDNTYKALEGVCAEYTAQTQSLTILSQYDNLSESQKNALKLLIVEQFKRNCDAICSNAERQCDMLLKKKQMTEKLSDFLKEQNPVYQEKFGKNGFPQL